MRKPGQDTALWGTLTTGGCPPACSITIRPGQITGTSALQFGGHQLAQKCCLLRMQNKSQPWEFCAFGGLHATCRVYGVSIALFCAVTSEGNQPRSIRFQSLNTALISV
jgi:hypothetical protein